MVDYTVQNEKVTNFEFVVSDFGTAGWRDEHYGGTPVYASGKSFSESVNSHSLLVQMCTKIIGIEDFSPTKVAKLEIV